jgi:ABC-2 type transport system ATP-binding protein
MSKNLPLEVTDIQKSFYETKAVRGISFSVKPGEVLGIVGPNGAGKTTTIKMILGLLSPDKGSIKLFGSTIEDSAVRRQIGYMPETPSFYGHLTGREILTFVGELFELSSDEIKKRSTELLSQVGLSKAADRRLNGYSKGMLQRICLAQALMNQPALLFLDEPMDGLDPIGRIRMKEVLLSIKEKGTAIVFNSHILSDVEAISDRIAIMDNGQILKLAPVSQLIPAHKNLEQVFIETVEAHEND